VRKIIVRNESERPRRLTFTSFADVTLAPLGDALRHPAFEKLFVRTEALPNERGCLAQRRPRSPDDPAVAIAHWLVPFDDAVRPAGFETDRFRFLGRANSAGHPAALRHGGSLSKQTGYVLDPILSVQAEVEVPPLGNTTFAFVTAVADSRVRALELARRFATANAITWTFHNAGVEGVRELQETGVDPHALPEVQRLLSAVLFPDARLRPQRDLGSSLSQQARLWGMGISGDHPVLLLRLPDPTDTSLLLELLKAHRFWRGRGVSVDLAVLLEGVSGYDDDASGRFAKAIADSGAQPWLHRPGGIFVLRADQLPPGERRCLEMSARVVLGGDRGDLRRQVSDVLRVPLEVPRFVPSSSVQETREPTPALPREEGLLSSNGLRARESPLRVSRQRRGARAHLGREQRRPTADPLAQRPGSRHALGGSVRARRGDRALLVSDPAPQRGGGALRGAPRGGVDRVSPPRPRAATQPARLRGP
jgi:cyclic beta-1,2-glucan synthetase